jgi:nucleotide-binding universal stress UspA family protein
MLQIKKILFPTDFSSCAESAFSHAAYLAARYEAELHILHVLVWAYTDGDSPMDYIERGISQEAKLELAQLMGKSYKLPKQAEFQMIHTQVPGGSAHSAILEYVAHNDIDLIVMGTHGRTGLDRLMMGSVSERVVQMSTCPVLTVHEAEAEAHMAVERMLVPIDFSEYTKPALMYAKSLAETYDAGIELMHVVQEAVLPVVYGIETFYPNMPHILDRSQELIEALIKEVGLDRERVTIKVELGHAVDRIVAHAQESDTDLIVMATHGLTGIRHLLMGSVAEKVVRMAPCPVFSIKSFGKSLLESTPEVAESAVQ